MIDFVEGNLLEAKVEAYVNTVNCLGIMGKGIALQFKNKYPNMFKLYQLACKNNEVKTGSIFVYKTELEIPKYILNFPTKEHWRNPSKIEYIVDGLVDLLKIIKLYDIKSVAIPALGCQNGGLQYKEVKPLILYACDVLPKVNFLLYSPQKFI